MIENEKEFTRFKDSQKHEDGPKGVRCVCAVAGCGEMWGAGATGKCAMTCKDHRTTAARKSFWDENNKIREERNASDPS